MHSVLTPEQAENLKRAGTERYGHLTAKDRDKVASDEAHGKVVAPTRARSAPPTAQMRAAHQAAEQQYRITGGGGGKIVGNHPAVPYGGGSATAHSGAGGGDQQAVIAKLDQINKTIGDFLNRTSHSPAMARGT